MVQKYIDWLKFIENYDSTLEESLSKEKISKINRFVKSEEHKTKLKEFDGCINEIKNIFKEIDFNNLNLEKQEADEDIDIYNIRYDKSIEDKIKILEQLSKKLDLDIIGGNYSFYTEVQLDRRYFNKIDIIDGIPNIIRNLGFGKKIYKKLIKTYNFVSSITRGEHSIESSMVWQSLASDKDVYIFSNNDNFICFWKNYDPHKIISKLEEYYIYPLEVQFDDDFISLHQDLIKKSDILNKLI